MLENRERFGDKIEIILFHGTTTQHRSSFLERGIQIPKTNRFKKDFGNGFYTTTQYWQAATYARRKASASGHAPMIVSCTTTLGHLRRLQPHLIVDEYDEKWMSTIIQGRWIGKALPYEWIYGRCADGDSKRLEAAYNEGYPVSDLLAMAIPKPETSSYEYDQLWFGTKSALSILSKPQIIVLDEIVGWRKSDGLDIPETIR